MTDISESIANVIKTVMDIAMKHDARLASQIELLEERMRDLENRIVVLEMTKENK